MLALTSATNVSISIYNKCQYYLFYFLETLGLLAKKKRKAVAFPADLISMGCHSH